MTHATLGNWARLASDYPRMTQSCDEVRTALSARLDGEDAGIAPYALDDHLLGCAGCRSWLMAAEQVTREVRLQSVEEVPDLTASILAAVAAEQQPATVDHARDRRRILQVALGLSALVQLALAIQALVFTGVDSLVHTSREAASFEIALAVGFMLAAWRPERARAFVPVAFVLAGCLTLTSVFDIAGGATLLAHEISHLAALAQAGLLFALSRQPGISNPRRTKIAIS